MIVIFVSISLKEGTKKCLKIIPFLKILRIYLFTKTEKMSCMEPIQILLYQILATSCVITNLFRIRHYFYSP